MTPKEILEELIEREIAHIKNMTPADTVRACGLIEVATGRKLSPIEVELVARKMENHARTRSSLPRPD